MGLGSGSEIRKRLFRILDPGSRGQKGIGSPMQIRNIVIQIRIHQNDADMTGSGSTALQLNHLYLLLQV
jgi:hypothetical protein